MTVILGSARIDERGKATGGAAGDQNGREVSTQDFYVHKLGWRVFRAKDSTKAARIAECMRRACANPNIGYDQGNRDSLYARAKAVGFDVSKVNVPCETDCSALVRVCCAYAGITLPADLRTANEPARLLATGEFTELTGAEYTKSGKLLRTGDILCTRSAGHTVVVVRGAEDTVLRIGAKGAAVREAQERLILSGFSCGPCGADGDYGADTKKAVTAFQNAVGLTPDGEIGAETRAKLFAEVEIRSGSCFVRAEPSKNAERLGAVGKGTRLPFLHAVSADGWRKVLYKGSPAWVSGKYSAERESV